MNSRYFLKEKGLIIEMEETLIEKMLLSARKYYPNEFGGLLIGYYTKENKSLIITDLLIPKSFKATPVFFERETTDLQKELKDFYDSEPSKYYVGEWHSHPNGGTRPSMKDVKAMQQISSDENVAINNPVLCIIGYTEHDYKVDFHLINKKIIYTYEQ